MVIAALYDIHGNVPALDAVLEDVRRAGADEVVVGGDVVPGPMPREAIARLVDFDRPVRFIRGNGDREVHARMIGTETDWYRKAKEAWRAPVQWTADQLTPEHERRLAGWPATLRVEMPGMGGVLFCHAVPRNDADIFTRLTPEEALLPVFAGLDVTLVVCGHTHMSFDRTIGGARVVNAGSVGMPFGAPGAYWLLIGPHDVEFRRTDYDLEDAARRVRGTTYPQAEEFAARNILRPPAEQEMLDLFAGVEVRLHG